MQHGLQERRRVALKLVNVTDSYFGIMISRGWFFGLFREVHPESCSHRLPRAFVGGKANCMGHRHLRAS